MPLPSSGTLALVADIGDEQHRPTASANVVSVADCGIAAGFSAPFAFSDFYSYAHITRSPYNMSTPAQVLTGIQAAPSTILDDETKCTVQVLGRFTEDTSGVIYESGGTSRGLAIYITSGGVLYCNAGDGTSAAGSIELSNTLAVGTDIREITVGIELLPYIRGTLYVNGSVVSSNVYGGQYSSGVSNSGSSGTGQVYGTIRTTHGPTTSAIADGTILACNIWDSYGLIPQPVSPSTDMLSRVSYTSGNYFDHSANQNTVVHGIFVHPNGEEVYLLRRASPSYIHRYNLSTKLDPTSASYGGYRAYSGITRAEGFSIRYSDGLRVYISEDADPTPYMARYNLGTEWEPTSSLSSQSTQLLSGGDFVGTARAPQGVEWFELDYTASSQRVLLLDQTGYMEVRDPASMGTVYETFTVNSTNVPGWTNLTNLSSCRFFYGGYKLLLTATNDHIYEFDLSTAYDITTITYSGSNVDLNTLIGSGSGGFNGSTFTCRGIWGNTYHPEETGLWVCGSSAPRRCFKIDLSY